MTRRIILFLTGAVFVAAFAPAFFAMASLGLVEAMRAGLVEIPRAAFVPCVVGFTLLSSMAPLTLFIAATSNIITQKKTE